MRVTRWLFASLGLIGIVYLFLRWLAGFDVTDRWAKEYKGEFYHG